MRQSKESKRSMKLVERLEKKQKKRAKRVQRLMLSVVLDYLSGFGTDGEGRIRNTSANLRRASRINRLARSVARELIIPFLNDIVGSLFGKVHDANDRYFTMATGDKRATSDASKAAKNVLKETLGFNNKRLSSDSGLARSADLDDIWQKIRRDTINAVSQGQSLREIRGRMKNYVDGAGSRAGEVERYFTRTTGDIYNQYQREQGLLMADELGLNHAVYQGGLIQSSRPFCEVRNGKVFSREEIMAWGTSRDKFGGYSNKSTGEFQGKTPNYNPFRDQGGFNCRHSLDWISNEFAYRLRPELRP